MPALMSIIIPVYNGEKYLRACLNSVFSQELEGLEVICVNDGSTDRSQEIIDEYAERYPEMICIQKPNGGLSSARNAGLQRATGEYIQFLDCDDAIAEHMLAKVYAQAKEQQLDMLLFDGESVFTFDDVDKRFQNYLNLYKLNGTLQGVMPGRTMLVTLSERHCYRSSACMYAIRRELIVEQGLTFYPGIFYEDNPFTMQALLSAKRTAYLKEIVYLRMLRDNSIVSSHKDYRHARSYWIAAQLVQLCIAREKLEPDEMKAARFQMDSLLKHAVMVYRNLSNDELQEGEQAYLDAEFMKQDLNGSENQSVAEVEDPHRTLYVEKNLRYFNDVPYDAEHPFVSVVLPVYNTESVLPETLADLQNQSLQNFEMIFVDDGSTDCSRELILESAKRDQRIKLLTQQNKFAGIARNKGLDEAKGEYIVFLDSDDRFEKDLLALAYEQACAYKAQVVVYDADLYLMPDERISPAEWLRFSQKLPHNVFSGQDVAKHVFSLTNPWTKLYQRQYILEEAIRYQGLFSSNDVFFNLIALACAERIVALPERLVHYRIGQSTNIQSTKDGHPLDVYEAFCAVRDELKKRNLYDVYRVPFAAKAMESMVRSLDTFKTPAAYECLYRVLHDHGLEELDIDCLKEEDMTCSDGPVKLRRCRKIVEQTYEEHLMAGLRAVKDEQKERTSTMRIGYTGEPAFLPLPKYGPFKMVRKKMRTCCVVFWTYGLAGVKDVLRGKLLSKGN